MGAVLAPEDTGVAEAPCTVLADLAVPVAVVGEGEAGFAEGAFVEDRILIGLCSLGGRWRRLLVSALEEDVGILVTSGPSFVRRQKHPPFHCSETEPKPMLTAMATAVACDAEVEVTIATLRAVVM